MSNHVDQIVAQVGHRIERVVYPAERIHQRVREMGAEITAAYPPGDDLLIAALRRSGR